MTAAMTGPLPPPPHGDADRLESGASVLDGVALSWATVSRRGTARANNQDASLATPPVFAVADGMGGHAAGDLASRCVIDALGRMADAAVTRAALDACLAAARAALGGIEVPSGKAPGSTLSGALLARDRRGRPCWMVVNIGDSRTYGWDGARLSRLTDDHTVASELAARGASAPTMDQWHPMRHQLTRAILADRDDEPDVWLFPIEEGNRLMACSDGVHGPLGDDVIGGILASAPDPSTAATELVAQAVASGGSDDATAVVVDVLSAPTGRNEYR